MCAYVCLCVRACACAFSCCFFIFGVSSGRLDDQKLRFIFTLFDVNETAGCRMDTACESDTETSPTREAKLPGEQIFHVQSWFYECNLQNRATEVQRNGSIYN